MSTELKPSPDQTLGAETLHIISLTLSKSQLWLTLVELKFENFRMVSSFSRFRWVLGRLHLDITFYVGDIIVPSRNYGALKAVKNRTDRIEDRLIRQLLQVVKFGNKKPAEILRKMRRLRRIVRRRLDVKRAVASMAFAASTSVVWCYP